MTFTATSRLFCTLGILFFASLVSGCRTEAAVVPPTAIPAPPPGPAATWQLTWSDEFNGADGSPVDPKKWTVITGGDGFGNNELEYYTERATNVRQEGGNLVLEARPEAYKGTDGVSRDYTSGRLETRGKFDQAYGRFEARMKLPYGKGIWPAFWMLGNDIAQGWPKAGEIDILETIGEHQRVYGTLHGPGYSGAHGLQGKTDLPTGQAVDTAFHVYAVEWSPNEIKFFVDDQLFATHTPQELPAGAAWVFQHNFFVLFDLAVGGYWPGNPDSSTVFPQKMLVDYVRVYKHW